MTWMATCDECGDLVTEIEVESIEPRIEPGSRLAPEDMTVSRLHTVRPCGHHGGWTALSTVEKGRSRE